MNFTDIGIIVMLILLKIQPDSDTRWWMALFILLVVAARLGFPVGILGMVVAAGLWRIVKDVVQGM